MVAEGAATFAELLQRFRTAQGLTQEELAERARISARTVSDLERGVKTRPHLATVRQIAGALRLSAEEKQLFHAAARHSPPPSVRAGGPGGLPEEPVTPADDAVADGVRDVVLQRLPVGGFLGALPAGALIAHERELMELVTAADTAARGEGHLVLIAGEAGIGKTRLAQEITRIVHERAFIVAAGRCYEPQRFTPYYPFLDVLSTLFTMAPHAIQEGAAHRWPYLARMLPDQLGSAGNTLAAGSEEQDRLFRAIAGFVLAVSEVRPLAIMVDDLHWADSASLHLLHYLARQTRSAAVLLLGTYRDVEVNPDHPLEATLADLTREQLVERITLRRLAVGEAAAFIAEQLGAIEAETELGALVYRHSDGNPFFTKQILQVLIDNGALYCESDVWKYREIGEIEVPESVRSVIARRVSRLERPEQEILRAASVLGPAFSFDDLVATAVPVLESDDPEDDVDAALARASDLGLVRVTAQGGYVFDHALTQQALYAALSPWRRRRLHVAAGEALEGLPARKRNQRAAELAWHFLQGNDGERAALYSLLAGDRAESVFAHGEAERQYRTALELAEDLGNRAQEADALQKLGVVVRTVGRYDEALGFLERAARLHHESGDLEREAQVVAHIGLLYFLRGTPESGIPRLQEQVARLEPAGPSRSLALLYAALVRLYNLRGDQENQLHASQRLLHLARELKDDRLLAEAEVHHGASLLYVGRYEEALQLLVAAIPRAEGIGDLHTVCIALGFCGQVHHGWHQVEQASLYRERALEVAERLGDPREISHRAVEAAYFAFLVGDWATARVRAERALVSALELDNLRAFVQPLFTLGELALYSGAWDEATNYLQESVTVAQHLNLIDHLREVEALLAERDLLEGNPEAALRRLGPLLQTPGGAEHLNFLVPYAAVCVAAGALGDAQHAISTVVAEASRQRLPVVLTEAYRIQGALARAQGDWPAAKSHLERAVRLARDITYPWGEARAHVELAVLHMSQGDVGAGRRSLETAIALFGALGAEPYRKRAAALLAGSGYEAAGSGRAPIPPPSPR